MILLSLYPYVLQNIFQKKTQTIIIVFLAICNHQPLSVLSGYFFNFNLILFFYLNYKNTQNNKIKCVKHFFFAQTICLYIDICSRWASKYMHTASDSLSVTPHLLKPGTSSECILPWARLFKLIISFIANPEALRRQLIPAEG